jgi:ribonuclease BN (tRNA processing enzyme)
MHADHFLDLVMLRNALKYGPQRRQVKLPVYVPASGEKWLHAIGLGVGSETSEDFFDGVFDVRTYDAASTLAVEEFEIRFAPTVHYIDAFAICLQSKGGTITYSGDTAPCRNVVQLARESDLFLCESTLGPDGSESGIRGHCSAREAALMASEAGVQKLLLTHYGSELSPRLLEEEVRRYFPGPCAVADDLMQLAV